MNKKKLSRGVKHCIIFENKLTNALVIEVIAYHNETQMLMRISAVVCTKDKLVLDGAVVQCFVT